MLRLNRSSFVTLCLRQPCGLRLICTQSFDQQTTFAPGDHFVKRKFAIVISYVGSAYSGLQQDINASNRSKSHSASKYLPTIEDTLAQAFYECGCILESNKHNLAKLKWSRSSRTDKGVHAAKNVLSGKLEVDAFKWIETGNRTGDNQAPPPPAGSLPKLVTLVNSRLPADIRVHSIMKINNGFVARNAAHWREYEYFLPLKGKLCFFCFVLHRITLM